MNVNSLDECYAFTGNVYISSFERKGKINASGYFRVFPSSKALLQPLEMTGIYLMTFYQNWKNLYGKKDVKRVRFVKYYNKYRNKN